MIRLPVWILCLLVGAAASAQQFGGNPPSLKWKQINMPAARVIFPVGLDSQAQQVAAIVRRLDNSTVSTIGGRTRKINIVLQNQTTIPNGYVSLAPFRSEFLVTPEQNSFDLGSLPWQKMLAIHEYRHVEQYNNFRVGLSGAFYYLFGESGQALANALAIPNWFWEGDAVFQETLVSSQGRGRLPFFFDGYRSLWAANKDYSWMQLRNGSLRDYIPDHYPLGYMMVAYGREKYGSDFWKRVSHDAAAFRGLLYPLQQAIERYSGVSFRQFRADALNWFRQRSDVSRNDYAIRHKHFVSDREFPQFIGEDSVIAVYSSYKQAPVFMITAGGKDTIISRRAISLDHYFSYRNHTVVYDAYETDPRWGWRDFSVIRVLDPASGIDVRLTNRTRYFSPDISEDGQHIVAVQEATDGSCALHLLDSHNGRLEHAIPNPDTLFYTYPKFFAADRIVSAVRNRRGQMALAMVDSRDGSSTLLTPFTWQTIGYPSVEKDTIWFTAAYQGLDRLFASIGGRLYRISLPSKATPAGLYAFSSHNGEYAWTDFTAVGYRMFESRGSHIDLEPLSAEAWNQPVPIQGIDSLENGPAHLLDHIGYDQYPATHYAQSYHLLNIHSWRPYISDPNYQYSLVSENVLNTLQAEAFVNYNRNEQYTEVGADATYAGWYPWLDLGYDYIFNRNTQVRSGTLYWNEMDSYAGFSIPLTFTRGRTNTSLQFGTDYVYERQYFTGKYKDSIADRSFSYLRSYISLTNQVQQARQEIYPRFAQTLLLAYDHTLNMSPAGQQLLASAYLYLPGAAPTHSVVLGAAAQGRDKFNVGGFGNSFPFSRGYTVYNLYRMYRLAANYSLPLVYPDWGFGNIVYFLRVRANLFYDYSHVQDFLTDNSVFAADLRSCGAEIFFDTKWWNELPIGFGIRYSRLLDPDLGGRGPNQWELILPLNLLSQGYSARPAAAR